MNKVYKLVWSKVRNCYVVASELAKSHSKGKSRKTAENRGDQRYDSANCYGDGALLQY